jgi:integrase
VARAKKTVDRKGKRSWQAAWWVKDASKAAGKREVCGSRFARQRDAKAEAVQKEAEAAQAPSGSLAHHLEYREGETFGGYAERKIKAARVRPSTKDARLVCLRAMEPVVNDLILADLSLRTSQAVLEALMGLKKQNGKPYSSGVVANFWKLYALTVRMAQEDNAAPQQILLPSRPGLPERERDTRTLYLEPGQKDAFIAAAWALRTEWAPFIETLFDVGLRINEGLSLAAADLDDFGRLKINKSFVRVSGNWQVGHTKTGKVRTVPLSPRVAKLLREQRGLRRGETLLFPKANGNPALYPWFTTNVWSPIAQACGLKVTPHIARHQYCSESIMAGIPSPVIIKVTGHASTATLERIYGHIMVGAIEATVDARDAWLRAQRGTQETGHGRVTPLSEKQNPA